MRYLLVFAIIALLVWRWQASRNRLRSPTKTKSPQTPTTMSRCGQCGLHVPAGDAIAGASGVYCSQDHRRLAED